MAKDKKIFNKIIIALSALLIITVSYVTGTSFAKYFYERQLNDTATVAKPVIQIGGLSSGLTNYTFAVEPTSAAQTEPQTYSFSVLNGSGLNVSAVALEYTISISTTGYLPLNIVLSDGAGGITQLTTSTLEGEIDATYSLSAGISDADDFSMSVSWADGAEYSESGYAGLLDLIVITVDWVQVD